MKFRAIALLTIIATFISFKSFIFVYFGFLGALASATTLLLDLSGMGVFIFIALVLQLVLLMAYISLVGTAIVVLVFIVFKGKYFSGRNRLDLFILSSLFAVMVLGLIFCQFFLEGQIHVDLEIQDYFYPILLGLVTFLFREDKITN